MANKPSIWQKVLDFQSLCSFDSIRFEGLGSDMNLGATQYLFSLEYGPRARSAVVTWLLVARCLPIDRNVAQIIARMVYESRSDHVWAHAVPKPVEEQGYNVCVVF